MPTKSAGFDIDSLLAIKRQNLVGIIPVFVWDVLCSYLNPVTCQLFRNIS
jgi:hypothetical protein